jgi:hypothetical protein
MTTILQIVPQTPGSFDGVGDYALNLAQALSAQHGYKTIFAVAKAVGAPAKNEFRVVTGLDSALDCSGSCDHVILHYANYGYQSRGVPLRLRNFARRLRRKLRGRWITTFHELYAFGPPWRSAFWLYPLQASIARDMIDISDVCFVSSDTIEAAIHHHDRDKPVRVLPVMSNFGELNSLDADAKSPRHWVICGGTGLILRSLRSFVDAQAVIPQGYLPDQLDVFGGRESDVVRQWFRRLKRMLRGVSCRYQPEITAAAGSEILRGCSFGWIDYFGKGKVWPGMILKSGSFAACCAHGVVPIVSHAEPPPAISGERFPAWYFVAAHRAKFPEPGQLSPIAEQIHAWYQRHASATCAARVYAEALA